MAAPVPSSAQGSLTASFKFAIDGVLRTLCTQRNMKIHWVSGLAVMLVGMALDLDVAARASILFSVFMVLSMEVLNTSLEAFVDLHVKQYARHAMVAKDAAAAAVLVLAVCAVIVFSDVLYHSWSVVVASGESVQRTVIFGVPLLIMQAALLTLPRRPPVLGALTALSVASVGWLAWFAQDLVFMLGAFGFVLVGATARAREPVLLR